MKTIDKLGASVQHTGTDLAEPMPKTTHLQLRGRMYWARVYVPRPLVPVLGKKELLQALDTADLNVAKQRLPLAMMLANQALDGAKRKLSGQPPKDAQESRWRVRNVADAWAKDPELNLSHLLNQLTDMQTRLGKNHVIHRVEQWLERQYEVTPRGDVVMLSHAACNLPRHKVPTFAKVIAGYRANQKEGRAPKTLKLEKTQDSLFLRLIDGKTPIDQIDRQMCRKVQADIKKLPAGFTRKLPAGPIDADKLTGKPMSPKTQNAYLGVFAALFRFAVAEGWLETSPAEGLLVHSDGVRPRDRRLPFSDEHLCRIFDTRTFPFDGNASSLWVPVLGLFTGARLGELCQLVAADIGEQEGIPCIRIRDEAEGQRLKTPDAFRTVPIHTEVLRRGFFEFAKDRAFRDGKGARLFPDLTTSDKFSKRFSRYLEKLGISDRRLVFHSFRHTTKQALENAEVSGEIIDALLGWTRNRGMRGLYGGRLSAQRLKEAVQTLPFRFIGTALNRTQLKFSARLNPDSSSFRS